ncbi:MAG TPA: hypothetical protein VJ372_19785 [Pyrinomonadaceae bacterium]|jgi:hypothetical protein|nr:hypothetical protein [Pyrinomonadaceae bacterium]
MDNTLIYSVVAGVTLVMLFVAARFALRWVLRFAIIGIVILALCGAAWAWLHYSSSASKARSPSTRRVTRNQ